MLADDHGDGVHNHTFPFMTIILRGGYWETLNTGKYWRSPGYIGFRLQTICIELILNQAQNL